MGKLLVLLYCTVWIRRVHLFQTTNSTPVFQPLAVAADWETLFAVNCGPPEKYLFCCFDLLEGRMNDDATLRDNKVTNGSKIMVVGSTINDVLAVTEPALKTQKQNDKLDYVSSKEPFCKQKVRCCCHCLHSPAIWHQLLNRNISWLKLLHTTLQLGLWAAWPCVAPGAIPLIPLLPHLLLLSFSILYFSLFPLLLALSMFLLFHPFPFDHNSPTPFPSWTS